MSEQSVDRTATIISLVVAVTGVAFTLLPLLLRNDPFSAPRQTTRTTVQGPMGTTTTVTDAPSEASLFEQSLGSGGLVLVRLGVAAGTAFLAGAVAQRILLASFSIKFAGLEFPEVAKASKEGLEQVKRKIDDLSQVAEDATLISRRLNEEAKGRDRRVDQLAGRIDVLVLQIGQLTQRGEHPTAPPDHGG